MDWASIGRVVGALVLAWLAFIALLWIFRPRDTRLGGVLRVVPDVLRLARGLIGDGTAPIGVRLALVGLLAWLVNPIDLVPEFIPVLGPLDDVIVAVLVLRYVYRRLGAAEFRRRWPGTEEGYRSLVAIVSRAERTR